MSRVAARQQGETRREKREKGGVQSGRGSKPSESPSAASARRASGRGLPTAGAVDSPKFSSKVLDVHIEEKRKRHRGNRTHESRGSHMALWLWFMCLHVAAHEASIKIILARARNGQIFDAKHAFFAFPAFPCACSVRCYPDQFTTSQAATRAIESIEAVATCVCIITERYLYP